MIEVLNTCYETTNASHAIAYYSHIVPVAVFLVVGGFVLFRSTEKRLKGIFALFIGTFSLWLIGDLVTWVASDYYTVYAFWSTLDFLEIAFFVLGAYFTASLIYSYRIPTLLKIFFPAVLIVPLAIAITGNATFEFNHAVCESLENDFLTNYRLYSEVAILALLAYLGFRIPRLSVPHKGPLYAIVASLFLFLGTFSLSSYLASLTFYYEFLFYGLLALPIFFIVLVYSITNFELFRVRAFGVQVLIYLILILISAQFLFIVSTTNKILTGITLVLSAVFGYLFQQSAIREIIQREHIEKLAGELEATNERQETLIHFIGHEVKGSLTKDIGAFASLSEGDFGPLPETMKPFVEHALVESRQSAGSVENILKAANLKKGTVTYAKAPFDLKALVAEAVEKAKRVAETKGLTLSFTADEGSLQMSGDKAQISDHVLRNLIDNSINYTPAGSVAVSLKKEGDKFVFIVKDTGVGITEEDKKRLFTEGGHGKDSQKINAHSTGYGLYIAKQIVEAHGGTVCAESEGAGKGSSFVVELPA